MATGNPGERRGARGPNRPRPAAAEGGKPPRRAKAKAKPKVEVSAAAPAPADPEHRRERQIGLAMEDCRLRNTGSREIAEDSLRVLLQHRDLLGERMAEGTITSEEGAVANGVQRNIMKWISAMGVDALRDVDDCPECNGTGRLDGEDCEKCDGMGVAE